MAASDPPELQIARDAVRAAATVCRNVQKSICEDVLRKEDRSPVTVADFASQALICRALAEAFPDVPIVAEEDAGALRRPENKPFLQRIGEELQAVGLSAVPEDICRWIDLGNGRTDGGRYWTLDPIDGTKGFLRGDQYAVSLALLEAGRIGLGVVACPNLPVGRIGSDGDRPRGVLLSAARGAGTKQQPLDADAQPAGVAVSETASAEAARFCESFESQHSAHGKSARVAARLNIAAEPLRIDSQAKYVAVARGEAEIYLRLPAKRGYVEKIWDHAGGALLVQEAGGRVTDMNGLPLDWTRGRELSANRGVVVTNGRLHEAVLSAIREEEEG